jgi:di/tricarboxylate transporter
MVWGPGGYKFYDFTKFGLILNISHMVVSCILAPYIWPFDEKIDWSKIDI